MGRSSSVGVANFYGLDGLGIESRWGWGFSVPVQTEGGGYPAFYTMHTGSFPGVKRPVCCLNHPTPSGAEDNEKVQAYFCTPLWAFMASSKGNFTVCVLDKNLYQLLPDSRPMWVVKLGTFWWAETCIISKENLQAAFCRTPSRAYPASCNAYWHYSLVLKRPEREDDHPYSSNSEANNELRWTSARPICLHDMGRKKFTFAFYRKGELSLFLNARKVI